MTIIIILLLLLILILCLLLLIKNINDQDEDSINISEYIELPNFKTIDEFNSSPWKKYYELVYGDMSKITEPPKVTDLQVLYVNYLKQALNVSINPKDFDSICPINENDIYSNMSGAHDMENTIWLYKIPPYKALENNAWVEVTHCTDPEVLENETVGSWFYYGPGSGIYFNLGNNTKAYDDHADAVLDILGKECEDTECVDYFPELFTKAAQPPLNYTSLQFLNHSDMRCGNTAIEIVDLKGVGKYPCSSEKLDSDWNSRYKGGYNASTDCKCDNTKSCMSCNSS
jgi:hypothetical protein